VLPARSLPNENKRSAIGSRELRNWDTNLFGLFERRVLDVGVPLETYRRFQQYLRTGDFEHLPEVVDVEGYTENCVGLTGWTTGLNVALKNFQQGVASVLTDMRMTDEDVVEESGTVVIRSRIEATHTGPFLGTAATGRRIAFDAVDMIRVKDGRLVWRFLLCDWYGVQQQLQKG
jgi:predicted ester cyclase